MTCSELDCIGHGIMVVLGIAVSILCALVAVIFLSARDRVIAMLLSIGACLLMAWTEIAM